MIKALISTLCVAFVWFNICIMLDVVIKSETKYKSEHNFILYSLWNWIKDLFKEKNWFGIMLSIVVLVLIIPAILILLFYEIVMWLFYGISLIWKLGNKNLTEK